MEQSQRDSFDKVSIWHDDNGKQVATWERSDDDTIQLQSPEAIALNGLLSDLEFMVDRFQSMADMHWKNYENDTPPSYYTKHDTLVAFGIYSNKAQAMRELVNKWKPNKK